MSPEELEHQRSEFVERLQCDLVDRLTAKPWRTWPPETLQAMIAVLDMTPPSVACAVQETTQPRRKRRPRPTLTVVK